MRRPWNAVNTAIYSLVSGRDETTNMNICSYVSPISKNPKLYAVAIDPKSYTYQLLAKNKDAILQLLHKNQQNLVRTLGKKSGESYNKLAYLEKKEELSSWGNRPVLKRSCAWVQLEKLSEQPTGDHQLFIFRVVKYKMRTDRDILTWDHLVQEKIIL